MGRATSLGRDGGEKNRPWEASLFSSRAVFNPRRLVYVLGSLKAALTEVISNIFVVESNGEFHFLLDMDVQQLWKLDPSPAPFSMTFMKWTIFRLLPSSLSCGLPFLYLSSHSWLSSGPRFSFLLQSPLFLSSPSPGHPILPHAHHHLLCTNRFSLTSSQTSSPPGQLLWVPCRSAKVTVCTLELITFSLRLSPLLLFSASADGAALLAQAGNWAARSMPISPSLSTPSQIPNTKELTIIS